MALTTRTLPAINNGVSRQPAILRSFDQTDEEINTWGYIATGVSRRPPTKFIRELDIDALEGAFVHHINRDLSERYLVVIDSGVIRVFDHETGDEKTVNAPGGLGYLDADGPAYRAVTVADYTFIVNTAKTVVLDDLGADETPPPDYVAPPGGSHPAYPKKPYGEFDPDDPGDPGDPGGPVTYPPNPGGTSLTGTVQKFEDLPSDAADGAIYKIVGSSDSGFVSYYVRKDGAVWDETVGPGLQNAIKADTMPHALVREADGTFTFRPFAWRARPVGDETTNPIPVFVGRTIREVFFYANRLAFLSDESVIFSVAGDFGDFWRRTVLDYIDADAFSVSASTTDVALLDFAIPFNDGIMLFSGQRQFSLSNGEAGLSASSVKIVPVTNYVMAPVRPSPVGDQVYFASDAGGYTALQEYTRLDGADATKAAEVTAHVPGLVAPGVSKVIGVTDLNAVILLASGADQPQRAYAYQFFWDTKEKVQSAWRVWDFGSGHILSGAFIAGWLYLVTKRGDVYSLEALDLRPSAVSDHQRHQIFLDRGVSMAGTYDAEANKTTFTVPYVADQDAFRLVRGIGATYEESLILPSYYTWESDTSVSVPGDETGFYMTGGEVFQTYLRFSRQYPLDWQGRPLTTGRLQLHTFTVNYVDSVYFRGEVQPYGPDALLNNDTTTTIDVFGARQIGSAAYRLGRVNYGSGSFTFPVAGNAALATVAVVNDSPYGSTFVSAEWEGLYFNRAI